MRARSADASCRITSFIVRPSPRPVAGERHTMHDPAIAVIIVDRIVQSAAIVPQRDRAEAPLEAARELGPRLVAEQIVEQGRAFLDRHVLEALGMAEIDVERLAPGL